MGMTECFEESMPLSGYSSIDVAQFLTLERHQLVFNQRLYIRTVQLARFDTVVDEKQHSEFMRTQHSCLRRVSFRYHVDCT